MKISNPLLIFTQIFIIVANIKLKRKLYGKFNELKIVLEAVEE